MWTRDPLLTRRSLLQASAAAAALAAVGCHSPAVAPQPPRKRTQGRLRHAGIGVGGMGGSDLAQIAKHPDVDIVALCDVDEGFLQEAAKKHPKARLYRDWRQLLRESDDIDSVHVTTPDHMHAPILLAALARGLHCYGQKPLTRTVKEARAVAAAAEAAGVVTQMGIQNRSNLPYQRARAAFQTGFLGQVYEVHVWSDRPAGWWPQGVGRPEGSDPVPATLDWDGWLGVSPTRPFKTGQYHPFAWRGWRDFGTGAQGDMACHLMDPALWFLELGAPLRLRSDGPTPNDETYPLWSRVEYEFAATPHTTRGPLQLYWHDGGKQVPADILAEFGATDITKNGCLFLGTEGVLLADPYSEPTCYPADKHAQVLEQVPQFKLMDHWSIYVNACLDRGAPNGDFAYAAHLTQTALLGNIALQVPHETLEWNEAGGRFRNHAQADAKLHTPWRADFEVPVRI